MPKTHIIISSIMTIFLTINMFIMKQKFKSNFHSSLNVECGFNSLTEKNFKFSNQFFMIAILFVIFDMELIAIMPMPISQMNIYLSLMMLTILIMLMFSLLMEWMNGLIEWTK